MRILPTVAIVFEGGSKAHSSFCTALNFFRIYPALQAYQFCCDTGLCATFDRLPSALLQMNRKLLGHRAILICMKLECPHSREIRSMRALLLTPRVFCAAKDESYDQVATNSGWYGTGGSRLGQAQPQRHMLCHDKFTGFLQLWHLRSAGYLMRPGAAARSVSCFRFIATTNKHMAVHRGLCDANDCSTMLLSPATWPGCLTILARFVSALLMSRLSRDLASRG